jgi:hypothetical protein
MRKESTVPPTPESKRNDEPRGSVRARLALGSVILVIYMAFQGCSKPPSATQACESLLGHSLATSARIAEWKTDRGMGEAYAYFLVEMSKSDFESFSPNAFVRNTDEEDSTALEAYGNDISKRMSRAVKMPSPSIHLVRRSPGKVIHAFWSEARGQLLLWITPGPEK